MTVKLGSLISEYTVRNKADEDIPVYSVTNEQGFCTGYFSKEVASQDRTTYKIVPRGCFAYNPSRINVGSVDVQECEDRVIVSPLYVVFSVDEKLNRRYLLHYLKSDITLTYIKAYASGSVRDNLKFSILKDFPINLPSTEEQEQIVATLDGIDHLIGLRKEELSSLDELVKSRFIELFGTEAELDRWACCTIGDVADVCVGVVIKPTQYYTDKGVPAFRSLNIGEMRVKDADWVYFTEEGHQKNQKSVIRKNDVLVVRSGAPGTACVATEKYEGYNAVDIIIAHPDNSKVNSVFLAAYTNMPHGMTQIREKTGGAAQLHFNVGGYKAMRLIIPPMELQEQFATFVEQTDKSKLAVQKALDELEILKKSLMQQYFG